MFTERDTTIADELLEHCGVSVTYARGATTATVTALIGRTAFWEGDASATHDRYESRDFLIKASALAAFTEPEEGDLITDAAGEWVVQVPAGVPRPWVYSDASRTVLRIHCWQGRS